MQEGFKCRMCGLCCKLSPITLLCFEEIILRVAAYISGLKVTIRPGYTIYDRRNGVYLGISYILELDKGKCPFLVNNKCILHYLYKPFICRSFPYTPKEVRYIYSSDLKMLTTYVEYGLSVKCPVIENDRERIGVLLKYKPYGLMAYMPNEIKAAAEMEEKRALILRLLSQLWRKGIVELDPDVKARDPNNVVNVYDFLRMYYPNLPYVLDMPQILRRVRSSEILLRFRRK